MVVANDLVVVLVAIAVAVVLAYDDVDVGCC